MSSKRNFVNGKTKCHRSERIAAKVPVTLSQETHVEDRQGAFLERAAASRSPPRCWRYFLHFDWIKERRWYRALNHL